MKKFAGMFYGRLESYAAALDASDPVALAAALRRNIYPQTDEKAPELDGLAGWMMEASSNLPQAPKKTIANRKPEAAFARL